MINALTIDLEPWMCFYDDIPLSWSLDEENLIKGTMRLLDILESYNVTATFFTLGVVYEWFPLLLDEIESRGHEIAFHGYSHSKLKGNVLKSEIEKSKDFVNKYNIKGFRAPEMEITQHDTKVLSMAGFIYDSSTYGPFNPLTVSQGIIEVPVSTYPINETTIMFPRTLIDALKNFEVPVGSGLFIGLLNSGILNYIIREINRKGQPFIMFIHPWQLTGLPRLRMERRIRGLFKLPYMVKVSEEKLRHLLEGNTFVSIQMLLSKIR